jgi:hypothetical protein
MKFNKKNFRFFDVSKLVKADWNYKTDDEDKKEKLKNNIKRNGCVENLMIRENEEGKTEIVNGNHRLDALNELKITEVMVYDFGKINKATAQRIAVETNETKFDVDEVKFAELIKDLNIEYTFEDLELTMPFTAEELTNLTTSLDFSWEGSTNKIPLPKENVPEVVIICQSDMEQKDIYNKLKDEGYNLRSIK